jgi:glutathionylspermidine synthase
MKDYVVKPMYSRDGSNVKIVLDGDGVEEIGGDYNGKYVTQAFAKTVITNAGSVIIGSWIIVDKPSDIGIRECNGLITDDLSMFVSHTVS